jgi:hypothetical protein
VSATWDWAGKNSNGPKAGYRCGRRVGASKSKQHEHQRDHVAERTERQKDHLHQAVGVRTTTLLVQRYDTASIIAAPERDIAAHGAPVVYRMDRASCQRTSDVGELLEAHGVLRLHGPPPRYPRYYGQLERQNREHREWLGTMQDMGDDEALHELRLMRAALNACRPRPTLREEVAHVPHESQKLSTQTTSVVRSQTLPSDLPSSRHSRGVDTYAANLEEGVRWFCNTETLIKPGASQSTEGQLHAQRYSGLISSWPVALSQEICGSRRDSFE